MKKRGLAIFLICCALSFILAAGLSGGAGALMFKPLDVGNYNDYGGGGGYDFGGGDYGGGYDYGGNDYDSSSYSGDADPVSVIIGIGIVVVIIIISTIGGNKKKSGGGGTTRPSSMNGANVVLPNRTEQIEGIIKQKDPNFSASDLITFTKQVYIDIENA